MDIKTEYQKAVNRIVALQKMQSIYQSQIENMKAIMSLNEYQDDANRTGRHDWDTNKRLTMAALGLNGEAGEVAEIVKKVVYHEHDLHEEKLILELGDVLWYLSDIATTLNVTLEYIAMKNIEKRRMRYPDGFDAQRSRERSE